MVLTKRRGVISCIGACALVLSAVVGGGGAFGSTTGVAKADIAHGAPKLKNYSIVETGSEFVAQNQQQTTGTVACPSGTIAYGGGEDAAGGVGMNLNSSFPVQLTINPLVWGWKVRVNNTTGKIQFFHVYAVCAQGPKRFTVSQDPLTNPAGAITFASADCPAGTVTLGGGADSSGTSTSVNMNSSFPFGVLAVPGDPGAWQVFENNASSTSYEIDAYAICGKKPKSLKVVTGTSVTLPAGPATARAIAQCPGRLRPTSGGVVMDNGGLGENMEATLPVDTQWQTYENNAQAQSDTMVPLVICAA
jgi:hypothetical protein